MTLSRRDALAALAGTTLGATALGYGPGALAADGADEPATDARVAAATAVAAVVYPSAVTVDASFVRRRVFGRPEPLPGHFDGLARAIDTVDEFCVARFDRPVAALDPADRHRALAQLGVYAVHANPEGSVAERVRYYLVNDLLYALFTHPTGGELLGNPNPPGWPGGTDVYQRGPGR
ncbi:gluconate 2-dehydrogenase subunit 3 family protein [Halomarina litorea]|uniref:gluconate 2-dehydrogenase subunit 3 family protein n=1 Tax=Halomarina litorea TaxID=2961595 RepID=UPI0020C220AC|nr:gluconate 2-dehydrogenase subunit 3 family protein [Halomarina sp. BCD28]